MSKLHFWTVECLTWVLTRIWGHLLIPVLLGSIFWLCCVHWVGWTLIHWVAWVGIFLVIGWLLTIAHWIRYYWELFTQDPE